MPNPFARAMKVAGDKNAGAILYRLSYWQAKTKIRIGARFYVVMSREEWVAETALTLDTYKRGLAKLVKDGLVEVEHHMRNGLKTAYLRLSDKANEALTQPYFEPENGKGIGAKLHQPVGATMHQTPGENAPTGWCETAPTIISEIKKGDKGDNLVSSELALAPAEAELSGVTGEGISEYTEGTVETMKTVSGKGSGKTVAELLAQAPSKPAAAKPKGKVTTHDLDKAWRESVSQAISGYVPPLTQKQIGMLKHFANACPPGTAEAVLRHVVDNWMDFAVKVQVAAGFKTVPTAPSIDFLLKHVGVGVNLYLEIHTTQPQQEAKVSGKVNAATMKLIALSKSKTAGGA